MDLLIIFYNLLLLSLYEHGVDVRHFSPIYRVPLLVKWILSNWFKTLFFAKEVHSTLLFQKHIRHWFQFFYQYAQLNII